MKVIIAIAVAAVTIATGAAAAASGHNAETQINASVAQRLAVLSAAD